MRAYAKHSPQRFTTEVARNESEGVERIGLNEEVLEERNQIGRRAEQANFPGGPLTHCLSRIGHAARAGEVEHLDGLIPGDLRLVVRGSPGLEWCNLFDATGLLDLRKAVGRSGAVPVFLMTAATRFVFGNRLTARNSGAVDPAARFAAAPARRRTEAETERLEVSIRAAALEVWEAGDQGHGRRQPHEAG